MDWGTAAILAGVVTLEGFRRLPPGALVLRRAAWTPWSVALNEVERGRRGGRWTLVSWAPPLFTSLVLLATTPVHPQADLPALLRRSRPWRAALDVLGLLTLVALVGGVPLATANFGGWGLLGSLAAVFALAVAATGVCARARASLGLSRRPALAALSPFATSQSGERLLESLLAVAPRLVAVRALLPPDVFRAWIRPAVYDADSAGTDEPDAELDGFLTPAMRAEILAPPPAGPGSDRYCPRCGACYRQGTACGDCGGLALVPFAS